MSVEHKEDHGDLGNTNLDQPAFKMVVVGDGTVGKSCLLRSLFSDTSQIGYVPTVFDDHILTRVVDGKTVKFSMWDTAGQEDYDRLRPLSYPGARGFLLCYSIGSKYSLENVSSRWQPEVWHHCPNVPVILVGTKLDLRRHEGPNTVMKDEGQKMAKKMGAFSYVECSSETLEGLDELFREMMKCMTADEKPLGKTFCGLPCSVL